MGRTGGFRDMVKSFLIKHVPVAGKVAAYALLGRSGYENRRAEITSAPPPDDRYVI